MDQLLGQAGVLLRDQRPPAEWETCYPFEGFEISNARETQTSTRLLS